MIPSPNTTTPAASHALPVADGRVTRRELRAVSRGHRLTLTAVAVIGLLSAALGLVTPTALGHFIDRANEDAAGLGTIIWTATVMIVAAATSAVGIAITTVLAAGCYHTMLAELRERLIERGMSLPQNVVERAGTGDLISRSNDDVTAIADAAPQIIPAFTRAGFTIIAALAGIAVLDWRYGVVLILALPVWALTVRWYLRTGPMIYRAERAELSGRVQQIIESARGYPTIQGSDLAVPRHHGVLEASWRVTGHSLRARTAQNMFFTRLNFAQYLSMAGILIVGFLLISAGQSTIGAATTATLFFIRLFGPINQLLFVLDILQSALASLNRIIGVITVSLDEEMGAETPRHTSPEASIAARVEGVTHRYNPDASPALEDVTLTVNTGQWVAVVGASGSGKTTLAAVIAGIHRPESGTVVRPERTAVITQEAHVFVGTLRENLTLAAPEATDDQAHAALEATGAAGLVAGLPNGVDTLLGGSGHELTAAQAQQIALARVMLTDPELLILDEATAESRSAHTGQLDHAAEAALTGRTGLVIAHRLSQAAVCDRIVVMEHGRIIEEGTHESLLNSQGHYAHLWRTWSAAHAESANPRHYQR